MSSNLKDNRTVFSENINAVKSILLREIKLDSVMHF